MMHKIICRFTHLVEFSISFLRSCARDSLIASLVTPLETSWNKENIMIECNEKTSQDQKFKKNKKP